MPAQVPDAIRGLSRMRRLHLSVWAPVVMVCGRCGILPHSYVTYLTERFYISVDEAEEDRTD